MTTIGPVDLGRRRIVDATSERAEYENVRGYVEGWYRESRNGRAAIADGFVKIRKPGRGRG